MKPSKPKATPASGLPEYPTLHPESGNSAGGPSDPRSEEGRFRLAFELANVGKSITLPNGEININQAFCDMLGYTREELTGKRWQDLTPPEEIREVQEELDKILRGEQDHSRFHKRYIHRDGSFVWTDVSVVVHRDEKGLPVFFITTILDIRERMAMVERMRESEEKYRSIFDNSNAAILLTKTDGRIMAANGFACRLFGRSESEICALGRTGLIDASDPRLPALMEERMRTGRAQGELFFLRSDGSRFSGEVSSVVFRDRHGEEYTSMIILDLTEEKEAEELLQQSEARYRNIIDTSPVGIAVHQDGKIAFANQAGALILGAESDSELIGRSIFDIIHPDHRETSGDRIRRMMAGEKNLYPVEDLYRRMDGTYVPVQVQATSLLYQNRPAVQVIVTDITERLKAEKEILDLNARLEQRIVERTRQLEMANQELHSFAYSVSHDLKAPLRGIDGYGRLLEESARTKLDETELKFLHNIRAGTRQMNRLIEELLAYSRLERTSFASTRVLLSPLLNRFRQMNREEIARRNVVIDLEPADAEMVADREGLEIVLRNLLENAIKFTREVPDPRIRVGVRLQDSDQELWVADNGIGFDMVYHDKVFEIFQRLHKQEEYPGTGIGLAMVAKAVQRMGGSVRAESQPGAGSVFFIRLPMNPTL
ncbi:MAG: PAS domain S-box protein [Bacteroidales bacterium]